MPRDGSGVYTLPAGNPVVTNTIIASSWANGTMSDIAAQLNNVLTRDGLLGPTGPFKLMDGTVNAPGLAWNSEPGLGWYRYSTSSIGVAAQGAKVLDLNASTLDSYFSVYPRAASHTTQLVLWNQLAGAPNVNSLTFSQDTTGSASIITAASGTATRGNLTLDAPTVFSSSHLWAVGNLTSANGLIEARQTRPADYTSLFLNNLGSGAAKSIRVSPTNSLEVVNGANTSILLDFNDVGVLSCKNGYATQRGGNGARGGNVFNIEYTASQAHLWIDASDFGQIGVNPSDERIKKNIVPLSLHEDAFMAIRPIEYSFRDVRVWKDDGVRHWGWSAQNIKSAMQGGATYGGESDMPESDEESWTPMAVADRPILAQTVLMVQNLINAFKTLDARLKALESK